jgi:hypothetical protein
LKTGLAFISIRSSITVQSSSKFLQTERRAFHQVISVEIVLHAPVEVLSGLSFLACESISSTTFEFGSRLFRIDKSARSEILLVDCVVPVWVGNVVEKTDDFDRFHLNQE